LVGSCYYSCNTLGGRILCLTRNRRTNTHSTSNRRSLTACLSIHWQKTLEIDYPLFP
jgi:hypothetical protein